MGKKERGTSIYAGQKKAFDRLRPGDCLEAIATGLNLLEERERHGQEGPALWREIRSIVGGIVPAVHWPDRSPPSPRSGTLLGGGRAITTPDSQWAVAGFNRLMRKAGVLPAARLDAQGKPEPFVHLPTDRARMAWALWWCFQLDELKRLRQCEGCGRWFRDTTKPLNQKRCSRRCTKRITMRAYRAGLRRRKATGTGVKRGGRRRRQRRAKKGA